ncbi:hypothetical protein ERX46_05105 [Brumimicrobium glaciale]|uniref:Lipocalin-like domain-containing protein n=1 Tax=Brumimicrobium glaciale TaxID=200475 RepID=A0A4Q4KQA6_9FLAO|nr:hypothetical protein [Brumimicrobium glaciale]RYM34754.1 hypothetical protein ERX46_05105 [Brumimicrobium glaciale]
MKYTQIITLSILLSLSFLSCKKESSNLCHDYLIGEYAVKDSISGGMSPGDYDHKSYDLEILASTCSPNKIRISNYANKNLSGTAFEVVCEVDNNVITVLDQDINNVNVRNSSGFATNDSIFFEISYESSLGEVFYGDCFGRKK